MDETTGKFVVLHFFPHSPVQVYGLFDSEQAAMDYAQRHGFAVGEGAYQVHEVLNCEYEEEPFDPVAMGWVGSDGRP